VSTLANRTATVVPSPPPSVSSVVPPSPIPFGSRLTSHVPSSSYRTHRRPPQPPVLRCHLAMPPRRAVLSAPPPPAISGENPAASPCPTQPSSLPRGVPAGRATPMPRGDHADWAAVLLSHANYVGPRAEMPTQHCAAIFLFSFFI
jgi:hypothetical protein